MDWSWVLLIVGAGVWLVVMVVESLRLPKPRRWMDVYDPDEQVPW